MNFSLQIKLVGDKAILIEWDKKIDESILDDLCEFHQYLKENCFKNRAVDFIPIYHSLTIIFPEPIDDFKAIKQQILFWYSEKDKTNINTSRQLWTLPICYDEIFGIDFLEMSQKIHLSKEEIIQQHTKPTYTVYGIGFLPGFLYLGGLSPNLEIARKSTPRLEVKKGSVGIAGKQTGVYPQASPGGWNIIGNCPISLFNPTQKNPCFASIGDKIQFIPISKEEHTHITNQVLKENYTPISTIINHA